MKILTPFCIVFLLFFHFNLHAQISVEALLEQPVTDVPAFDTTKCKDCIFLRVPYGTSDFLNLDVLKRFEGNNIIQVDMVYSSFSRSEGFDQMKLNRQRLANLGAVAPELFDGEDVTWEMIRQTNCKSLEESERLFHGFVVHITPGKAIRDADGKLKPVGPVEKKEPKAAPKLVTRDSTIRVMNVTMRSNIKKDCVYTGKYYPNNKAKKRKGIRYASEGNGRKPEKKCKEIDLGYTYDTTYYDRIIKVNAKTGKPIDGALSVDRKSDVTVTEVMTRKWDAWKGEKVIVVQDVTGSMSSYLTQMLAWNEQSAAKGVDQYVFFNDGDNKAESKKVIGKIGGVYYLNSSRLIDIQETAQRAAKAGYGGDAPENNIEAAIFAQNKCPECTEIVMVADNYAAVKDISLIKQVKKPIRVVVCGGNGEVVHSDYLTIAAITGGSVHTSKLDLELAGNAVEGQTLIIGERKYRFTAGRFSLLKE